MVRLNTYYLALAMIFSLAEVSMVDLYNIILDSTTASICFECRGWLCEWFIHSLAEKLEMLTNRPVVARVKGSYTCLEPVDARL